jgi:HK97 gp10 family phage protein
MEGNIDNLINRLNNMGTLVRREMERPLLIAGEIVRANIVKGIRGQKFDFAPLAESTIERKKQKNYSDLILIAQGDYVASFTVEQEDWDEVHIGTNHAQGRALEFGYEPRNLPARPHVAPALEASREKVEEKLGEAFKEIFK